MTALQKSIVGATIAVALGGWVFVARRNSRLREEIRTLQQEQPSLNERIRKLEEEQGKAKQRLLKRADEEK
ncbi:MAG TPA: hypothetical protein VJA21_28850 [Verrucomicrobiae bacterium]